MDTILLAIASGPDRENPEFEYDTVINAELKH